MVRRQEVQCDPWVKGRYSVAHGTGGRYSVIHGSGGRDYIVHGSGGRDSVAHGSRGRDGQEVGTMWPMRPEALYKVCISARCCLKGRDELLSMSCQVNLKQLWSPRSRDISKQAKQVCMHTACMHAHLSPQHLRQNRGVKASLGYIASPGLKTDGKPRSEGKVSQRLSLLPRRLTGHWMLLF